MSRNVQLGWVIVFVPDVREALAFYEAAFGFQPDRIDQQATFAQLSTGSTALSFATEERAETEISRPIRRGSLEAEPVNMALSLVFEDPYAAFERAVAAGCLPLASPEPKPHGQTVGIVRDRFGTLVEIGSSVQRPPARDDTR
jgi:lactoylglutathione lyase